MVLFAKGLMRSTKASPASMSTPADLYVIGEVMVNLLVF
jgi:hypothetical protein